MGANVDLFEDSVKLVIPLKRDGDELASAALPDVEILSNNTLLVDYAGGTTKYALPAPVATESAKVKWSKGRGTLTFTATRIKNSKSQEEQAGAAGAMASTVANPISLPAADDGCDTGLQEMYGAELFTELQHQGQQRNEPCQPAEPQSQCTSSCRNLSDYHHAHISASLAASSSSCGKPVPSCPSSSACNALPVVPAMPFQCLQCPPSSACNALPVVPSCPSSSACNGDLTPSWYVNKDTSTTTTTISSSSAKSELDLGTTDNSISNSSSRNKHTEVKAGGCEQANGMTDTSNSSNNSSSSSNNHEHANGEAGSCIQANGETSRHQQASSSSSITATTAPALPTTSSPSQAVGTARDPPHGASSSADKCSSSSREQGKVPEAQGIDCSCLASFRGTAAAATKAHKSSKKAAKEEKRRIMPILDAIADSLAKNHWAVCDDYVPIDQVIEVRKELKRLEEHYVEGEIWVGKEADTGATIARKDVRGDVVLWLDQEALEATAYLKDGERRICSFKALKRVMDSIDDMVKGQLPSHAPSLANVRERSDAMMAIYPGGGSRFAKHIDNTANDGRRLTLLCYLNPNWKQSNGGALRLTPPNGKTVDVYPQAGRLAMFMSKTVAHEVMPTQVARHSFTLWFYDAIERAEAVATAQVHGRGQASEVEQQEARDLIRDMLSRGGEIQATYEGVAALQHRVARTSRASMGIVASIVGAPSTQALLDSIQHMVPSELENLNYQLAFMGQGAEHAHAPSF